MSFFDNAYLGTPPWDIGKEQLAFKKLVERKTMNGPILDVGCGTGENSLFFASLGFKVTGIDTSELAISKAREKSENRHLQDKATFLKIDLFELIELNQNFNTVIDSGVFHMFDNSSRNEYQKNIKKILNSHGFIYILAFSYLEPLGIGPSQRLTKEDYINTFNEGWKIKNFEHDVFETRITNQKAKGLLTTIEKL